LTYLSLSSIISDIIDSGGILMIKRFVLCLLVSALLIPMNLMAGGSTAPCATKYPIVLAHGMGAQYEIAWGILYYWNRIPDALEEEGAQVYITSVNSVDGTANKALQWKRQLLEILAVSGAKKVNVIGHSHGCLYTRYAMSNLGIGSKVASHTSIAGPHRGSVLADTIMDVLPDWLKDAGGPIINTIMAFIMGDVNGDIVQNGYDLCTDYMVNTFNPNTPDVAGVYYQSWAFKVKNILGAGILAITWPIMIAANGEDNDGLVGVSSAKWGKFRGVVTGDWWANGVNHLAAVDMLFGLMPGFDAPQFFVNIVSELKSKGY
jgi:triacylglycerol lipase